MTLDKLFQLVIELNVTTSSNAKIDILCKYDDVDVKSLLKYTFDTINITFGVTSKSLKDNPTLIENHNYDIKTVLEILIDGKATGGKATALVNGYISKNPIYKELVYNIIDRNLKCRIDKSLINYAFPGLIPEFEVALAESYFNKDRKERPIDFINETWYWSRKLDGCRCISIINANGDVNCISRQGKEFKTLDVLKAEIKKLGLKNVVIDGEICVVDENGEEDFQEVMKVIRKKDYTISKPKYKIFDFLTIEEFYSKISTRKLSERKTIIANSNFFDVVSQTKVIDRDDLIKVYNNANKLGWEGLIIRKDDVYKGKRSWDMLKLKAVFDAEYTVTKIVNGPIRNIINGIEIEEKMLSEVDITHKGSEVSVGSGFTIAQRKYYFAHPEEIVGKIITVKYTEETIDQNGKPSLRFPIFKEIHGDKREV